MKAIVVNEPGGVEVLQIEEIDKPMPSEGWVLIKVAAFGLNRAEMFTRKGHSPAVQFPRVLGIECVGIVEQAPGGEFTPGQKVAAVMGGMGREFHGSYAEYTCVRAMNVVPLDTNMGWVTLASIPEAFLTAWGALVEAMVVEPNQSLVVRGGTSSVGMATISIAKDMGLAIAATTRNMEKADALRANGADHVIIDDGGISKTVREVFFPGGADHLLELVGVETIVDSLRAVKPRGVVCLTGILGNRWTVNNFSIGDAIPSGVRLTRFSAASLDPKDGTLQKLVDGVSDGRYNPNIDKVFEFDEIQLAHQYMDDSRAVGKIVVIVD
jgi:NADPH2:quinone reductase